MVPHELEVSEAEETRDPSRAMAALEEALLKSEEGVLVKLPDSTYKCGERDASWVKLKPDYIGEGREEFDVLIVGTSWTKGARAGHAFSYICGVADDTPPGGTGTPTMFRSFCRVGSGLRIRGDRSHSRLEEHLLPFKADVDSAEVRKQTMRDSSVVVTWPSGVQVTFSGDRREELHQVLSRLIPEP